MTITDKLHTTQLRTAENQIGKTSQVPQRHFESAVQPYPSFLVLSPLAN